MGKPQGRGITEIPLKIVGSTVFGRYQKMSSEETYNMIISDNWLVGFGGFAPRAIINNNGQGRGIYSSQKNNKMYAVTDNDLWQFTPDISRSLCGNLDSFSGDVFIAENNTNQIAVSDLQAIYIYNYVTNVFVKLDSSVLGFTPGYITFQDSRFICADTSTNQWRLSKIGDGLVWPPDAQHVGEVSTKPTNCVACIRFPGKGNMLLVMGETVGEQWMDVGSQLFPYQRSQSTNLDYGCINPASIAANEDIVCWVAINEQSGVSIMNTTGGKPERISTDGIDFKLSELKYPQFCYGFMVRIAGHLCYVASWTKDNLSYLYDFNTQKFFTLSDENMNVFPIKRIAYFNNTYYFVSIRDGNLYELNTELPSYAYGNGDIFEIPRIRIIDNIQMPDQRNFIMRYAGFTIEQGIFNYNTGDTNNIPHVDLSVSYDGGTNYSSNMKKIMNTQGNRKSMLRWDSLGQANDATLQYRFHALNGRFTCYDGTMGVF